jgi:hypothetical protein
MALVDRPPQPIASLNGSYPGVRCSTQPTASGGIKVTAVWDS